QNAIKYSPGGGTIRVVVAAQETGVEVSVQDSGIGIPDTALGQLFQRFYRAPNTGAHPISGMGVGLYVSHQIVQAHGGSMTVSSVEGEGSTFRFWLPSDLPLRTENQ
ncbi:MAG TPA: ATP-binding protein, partial [Herpetosiphonaceae bacterium]|nr:ATP-binding protein [Herpetosiphonaceae bacterium]